MYSPEVVNRQSRPIQRREEWESSYKNGDNFLFYPHEEVVRFVSKYIRKRIGLESFQDIHESPQKIKVLDLGCGVGRHVKYCAEMGLDVYGIDLSSVAIEFGKEWLSQSSISDVNARMIQGDIQNLPWSSDYFSIALSHGVLDSMPWETSRAACKELARSMVKGGLFYCDLVSGDSSSYFREYAGEQVVKEDHEKDTIQQYFNMQRINELIHGCFSILECKLIRVENVLRSGYYSRYHLVLVRV